VKHDTREIVHSLGSMLFNLDRCDGGAEGEGVTFPSFVTDRIRKHARGGSRVTEMKRVLRRKVDRDHILVVSRF